MPYHSQINQDQWVHNFFNGKRNGVFLDIGAHDGIDLSNTAHFEEDLNWTGICIEANPDVYARLKLNRKCITINCCAAEVEKKSVPFMQISGAPEMLSGKVDNYSAEHVQLIESELLHLGGSKRVVMVPQRTVTEICLSHGIEAIDYMTLDTEGSEYPILRGTDFSRIYVNLIDVECNYPEQFGPIDEYLKRFGFVQSHMIGCDRIYVNMSNELFVEPIRPLLSILIPTVVGRELNYEKLCRFIESQITDYDKVELLTIKDNKEISIGQKRTELYRQASGKYSVQIDDDDWLADDYVESVLKACESGLDCVGYLELHTEDGDAGVLSNLSLEYTDWHRISGEFGSIQYARTPFFKTPILTSICRYVPVPDLRFGEDHAWSKLVYSYLHTQKHIPRVMYYHRYASEPHNVKYGIV